MTDPLSSGELIPVDGRVGEPHARRLRGPVTLLAVECAGLAAVRLRDPHVPGSWGTCPFRAATGVPCPFCGSTRAAADLTHADLSAAWSSNAYGSVVVVVALAATVGWVLWAALSRRTLSEAARRRAERVAVVGSCAVLAGWVVFGVARLAPGLAWLQPPA